MLRGPPGSLAANHSRDLLGNAASYHGIGRYLAGPKTLRRAQPSE